MQEPTRETAVVTSACDNSLRLSAFVSPIKQIANTYQDTLNPYSTEQNNRIHNRLFAGISASVTMEYIKAKKSTTKKRKAKNNKAYLNYIFIIIGAEMPARADYTTVHNATTQQITKHDITSYIGFTLLIANISLQIITE